MNVHLYEDGLVCVRCARRMRRRRAGDAKALLGDPQAHGGGEADSPRHCEGCGIFLQNPLTHEGINTVVACLRDHLQDGRGMRCVLEEWISEYRATLNARAPHLLACWDRQSGRAHGLPG